MPIVTARELITAGTHFGHRASCWNPKMRRYIWGKRNKIHIIDVRETIRGLVEAYHFLRAAAAGGGRIIIVGTKRQAREAVRKQGVRTGMPYVAERWLGGTLTNLGAIRSQVKRLEEIERLERTGGLSRYNKKMISAHNRRKRKLLRNLDGIRTLDGLPVALIAVDPSRERIAVNEAYKLRMPILALIDTDSDPDPVDIPIPGNDDAIRAIEVVLGILGRAVIEGRLAGGLPVPKEALTSVDQAGTDGQTAADGQTATGGQTGDNGQAGADGPSDGGAAGAIQDTAASAGPEGGPKSGPEGGTQA